MQAEAVLVLGKELRRHPERALRELKARSAAASVALRQGAGRVLTLEAGLRGQQQTGARIVRELLQELEVPAQRVIWREQTRSTREEALVARQVMGAEGLSGLTVLTASYHAPRAARLFTEVFGADVRVSSPDAFLPLANPRERAWIIAGRPDAQALQQERGTEALFSLLARAMGPLPRPLAWQLELRAAGLLRRAGDR